MDELNKNKKYTHVIKLRLEETTMTELSALQCLALPCVTLSYFTYSCSLTLSYFTYPCSLTLSYLTYPCTVLPSPTEDLF